MSYASPCFHASHSHHILLTLFPCWPVICVSNSRLSDALSSFPPRFDPSPPHTLLTLILFLSMVRVFRQPVVATSRPIADLLKVSGQHLAVSTRAGRPMRFPFVLEVVANLPGANTHSLITYATLEKVSHARRRGRTSTDLEQTKCFKRKIGKRRKTSEERVGLGLLLCVRGGSFLFFYTTLLLSISVVFLFRFSLTVAAARV